MVVGTHQRSSDDAVDVEEDQGFGVCSSGSLVPGSGQWERVSLLDREVDHDDILVHDRIAAQVDDHVTDAGRVLAQRAALTFEMLATATGDRHDGHGRR